MTPLDSRITLVNALKELGKGDVTALAALWDVLESSGDRRFDAFKDAVRSFLNRSAAIKNTFAERARRRRWTEREALYRRDEASFEAVRELAGQLERLFWFELMDRPLLQAITEAGATVEFARQAERLRKGDDQDNNMKEEADDTETGAVEMNEVRRSFHA